jgi:hypothetical protein
MSLFRVAAKDARTLRSFPRLLNKVEEKYFRGILRAVVPTTNEKVENLLVQMSVMDTGATCLV